MALAASLLSRTIYGYDADARLAAMNDGNNDTAIYSYLANSALVGEILFQTNSAPRMTTLKTYDYLNRLTAITSQGGTGVPPVAYNYNYNAANQRTQDRLADGSYWNYQYDALGQVTAGRKFWADGTVVAGQQFGYAFETIGNRTQTQTGGDQYGRNLRVANYTANNLNQITSRDVPGYVEVQGVSFATNQVAVNGNTNSYRKGEYFRQEVGVANGSAPVWTTLTVTAPNQAATTGSVYMAQAPENFTYDLDGNLINDGRWTYTWDAENRLINLTNNTGVGPLYNLAFIYDSKGRRILKIVTTNGVAFATNTFLYDGWNLVAELGTNYTLLRNYTWGNDLSGSAQGAGGVGGLLEVAYHGASTTNAFVAYDGNGNVGALINAGDGTLLANYEYGPFGETIRSTGPLAKNNPVRFSTKYQDDESDLIYYGYRFYKPSTGTWISRDPCSEAGFFALTRLKYPKVNYDQNLYEFVRDTPIIAFDLLGLLSSDGSCTADQLAKIQQALKDSCAKAKACAGACPNPAATKAINALCDSPRSMTVHCTSDEEAKTAKQCDGNCGWTPIYGGNLIELCPLGWDPNQCGGIGCVVFHEALHAGGGMKHLNDPDTTNFRNFDKCMGCKVNY